MKGGLAVMLDLARGGHRSGRRCHLGLLRGEEVAAAHNGLRHLFEERPDLLAGDVAVLGEPTDG